MPDLREDRPVPIRDSSVMVYLSLYLLLLAFFILLNTISQREQKRAQMAIGSVAATFRAPLPADVVELTTSTGRGLLEASDPFQREIRRIFEETLAIEQAKVLTEGNVMRITVAASALWLAESGRFRPAIGPFLERIADGVARQEEGARFEVEMIVHTGASMPALSSGPLPLALRRAGAFARRMRAAGVPAHSISAGIGQGDAGSVQLSFYVREIERARISFDRLAAVP